MSHVASFLRALAGRIERKGTPRRQRLIVTRHAVFAPEVELPPGFVSPSAALATREQIDPDKLDLLADWLDRDDAVHGRTGFPEVQADLRRWAKMLRGAA